MDFNCGKLPDMGTGNYCIFGTMLFFMLMMIVFAYLGGKQFWMFSFAASALNSVLLICVPWVVANMISYGGKFDGVHFVAIRGSGAVFVFFTIVYWQFRDCRDATVTSSVYWSMATMWSLFVLLLGYEWSELPVNKTDTWTYRELTLIIGMTNSSIAFAGNILQLVRLKSWGGYPETLSRINFHTRADYLLGFICSLGAFAFPQMVLRILFTQSKFDDLHLYTVRALALHLLAAAILFGRASNFLSDQDKGKLCFARVISNVAILVTIGFSLYQYGGYTNYIFGDLFAIVFMTLNAAAGYNAAQKQKAK